jgi:hypothetical protein
MRSGGHSRPDVRVGRFGFQETALTTGIEASARGRIESEIRSVTRDEVEEFFVNGWVRLPRLIGPALAAMLLERARLLMGPDGESGTDVEVSRAVEIKMINQVLRHPSRQDDLMGALATSNTLGRNAARLFGRESPIRLLNDILLVKLPVRRSADRGRPTDLHQDYRFRPFDRGSMNFWVALDEVKPEQGSMYFLNGSHKLGPLGASVEGGIESYSRLRECPVSEPLHLQPGDATAHHALVVHGARENATARPRWAYALEIIPGDALYTGAPSFYADGLNLEILHPPDHPDFPLIYSPGSTSA